MSNEKNESNPKPKTENPIESPKLEPNPIPIKPEAESPDINLTSMKCQIIDMETKAKQLIAEAKKKRDVLKQTLKDKFAYEKQKAIWKEYKLSLFEKKREIEKRFELIDKYPNDHWIAQMLALNELNKNLNLEDKKKIDDELTQYWENFEFKQLSELIFTLIKEDMEQNEGISKLIAKKADQIITHLQKELETLIKAMNPEEFIRCMKLLTISGAWRQISMLHGDCIYLSYRHFTDNLSKTKKKEIKEAIEKEFKDFISEDKKDNETS